MQGEEAPEKTGTLKTTFVPGPKTVGGASVSEIPEALGPRNCGQLEAPADETHIISSRARTLRNGMNVIFLFRGSLSCAASKATREALLSHSYVLKRLPVGLRPHI